MEHFLVRTDLALESKERCGADSEEIRGVLFEELYDKEYEYSSVYQDFISNI